MLPKIKEPKETETYFQRGIVEGHIYDTLPDIKIIFPEPFNERPQIFLTFEPVVPPEGTEALNSVYSVFVLKIDEKEATVRLTRISSQSRYPGINFKIHWLAIGS